MKKFPFAAPVATVLIGLGISIATTGKAITGAFVAILLLNLTAWLFGRLDRRSAMWDCCCSMPR